MEKPQLRGFIQANFKMRMKKIVFSLILFMALSFLGMGQNPDYDAILSRLDRFYEKTQQEWDVPGMSVAIVKNGKIIFSKGYGEKETGKNERPDGNTLFAIASNSKAFTASMLGQLVEEGRCNWDDKAVKYLPWFRVYDPWVSSEITLRDLLSHRVGLGTFSGDVIWYKSNLNAREILDRAAFLPASFPFRAGYGYSNLMFIAAGEVIREITGKSWYDNVKERFLLPLEMNRTTIYPDRLPDLGNYAIPHARMDDRNIPIAYTDWSEIAAMGGLLSSVNEVANWMIFNMNQGKWNNRELLKPSTLNFLWTPHNNHLVNHASRNEFNNIFSGYGLGWSLRDYHGRLFVGHTGGYDGMLSAVSMLPDEKLGVVVLTNGMKSPFMAVTYQTIDAFLGKNSDRDWSAEMLRRTEAREKNDTRISDRIASQVKGTNPSLPLQKYAGTYKSDIYGNIIVQLINGRLHVELEHSPGLSFYLRHFHYDVFEIEWDEEQAWFRFGTVKFNTDNYLNITGMDFDVPNDDIFFEELKPRRTDTGVN